jgi:hypothetical protein
MTLELFAGGNMRQIRKICDEVLQRLQIREQRSDW